MSELIKIYPQDYERVLPLLHQFENSTLTDEQWKRLFENRWNHEEGIVGYGLENNGRIVGFIGLIFANRLINDEEMTFCNISSWIVDKEFRHESLILTKPLLKMKDYVITALTSSNDAYPVWKRIGFIDIEKELTILFPNPFITSNKYQLVECDDDSIELLNIQDKQIYLDHKNSNLYSFIIKYNEKYCYIVMKKKKIKRLPVCLCLYISNKEIFNKGFLSSLFQICFKTKTIGAIVENRFISTLKTCLKKRTSWGNYTSYLHKNQVDFNIDYLYSEMEMW